MITRASRQRECRTGGHPLDPRTAQAGGELCFDCATSDTPAIVGPQLASRPQPGIHDAVVHVSVRTSHQTRYAVRHTDGRWLVIGHSGREIRPLWTPDKAQAWTWPSMSEAVMAAMSLEGEIRECLCWTVEPV